MKENICKNWKEKAQKTQIWKDLGNTTLSKPMQ